MDKWEEITQKIIKAVQAEEPNAALVGSMQLIAEFGRTLELISEDLDRLASAAERANGPIKVESHE